MYSLAGFLCQVKSVGRTGADPFPGRAPAGDSSGKGAMADLTGITGGKVENP